MRFDFQMALAAWGATLATIVAFFNIRKALWERPCVSVRANLCFKHSTEDAETHGLKVGELESGRVSWKECDIEFYIANAGLHSIQIVCIFAETEDAILQATPSGLPVVLAPNMGTSIFAQPELIAMAAVDASNESRVVLKPGSKISVGVMDALGKKHTLKKDEVINLLKSISDLPHRLLKARNRVTGEVVTAFQSTDGMKLLRKGTKARKRPLWMVLGLPPR